MKNTKAVKRLQKELKDITLNPIEGGRAYPKDGTNLFEWHVQIDGIPGTIFEGMTFTAALRFPTDYPFNPPDLVFEDLFHPNVYVDGKMCISILHPAGKDEFGYEAEDERWTPIQNISSILVSVRSALAEPNFESPANVDASVLWQRDPDAYLSNVLQRR